MKNKQLQELKHNLSHLPNEAEYLTSFFDEDLYPVKFVNHNPCLFKDGEISGIEVRLSKNTHRISDLRKIVEQAEEIKKLEEQLKECEEALREAAVARKCEKACTIAEAYTAKYYKQV